MKFDNYRKPFRGTNNGGCGSPLPVKPAEDSKDSLDEVFGLDFPRRPKMPDDNILVDCTPVSISSEHQFPSDEANLKRHMTVKPAADSGGLLDEVFGLDFPRQPKMPDGDVKINGGFINTGTSWYSRFIADAWKIHPRRPVSKDALNTAKANIQNEDYIRAINDLAQDLVNEFDFLLLGKQLYYFQGAVWIPLDKDGLGQVLAQAYEDTDFLQSFNDRRLLDLYHAICRQPSIQRNTEEVRKNPMVIPCEDGLFDLETMRARETRADDYIFTCTKLLVGEIGCGSGKQFTAFLDAASGGDDQVRQQILEFIGVMLSDFMPKNFFLLLGPPDSGKSQLLNLVRMMLGPEAVQSISNPNQLAGRYMFGSLMGKRLCYCPDVARVRISQSTIAAIKQMTGGDLLLAEVKYKQPVSFENEAKLVLLSNYPLQGTDDEALLSRLITIPFRYSVPKEAQIPHLADLLFEERGYIADMAIERLTDLKERNFCFTKAEAVGYQQANQDNELGSSVSRFVEECCELNCDGWEYVDNLHKAYLRFSETTGAVPLTIEVFSRILRQNYPQLEQFRTKAQRGYRGIKVVWES